MKYIRYPHYHSLAIKTVVTIGNFDGVHLGHQALIASVVDYAKKYDLNSCVVSMQPLASQYFMGKSNVPLLTPFKCKYHLIKALKVDNYCLLNFNKNLAGLSAIDFIESILLKGLNAQHIIIGDDFRFGKNRVGDIALLKQYCKPRGVTVAHINTVFEKDNARISSSLIRKHLEKSEFDSVEQTLGRRFSILGRISKGKQLGRTLGFPTINIKLKNRAVPINGIFCVKVKFSQGETYQGAASIGTRPTVNGKTNILEVFILDFNKQVYGQNVEVLFYHKIRNEVKFDSLSELKQKINDDVLKTRHFFSNEKKTKTEPLREQ
jgi:riboflavin kinase/FMN adenylyltransferase